jgi:hypothetical protein
MNAALLATHGTTPERPADDLIEGAQRDLSQRNAVNR